MSIQTSLTRVSFEEALTSDNLKITRIIQLALIAASLIFALAVVLVFLQHQDLRATPAELDNLKTLTIAHLVLLIFTIIGGRFQSNRIFSPGSFSTATPETDSRALAQRCVGLQRTAILIRLASLEGASFFGLAICMIGATNGALATEYQYWINLSSVILFLVFGIATFPTKERLADWFEKNFSQS